MSLLAQEDESELKMALQLLSELRDLRKKTVFLQMMKEIEDLKSQLKQSKKRYGLLKHHIKNLTIENDWLHSLTGTPVNSPIRKDLDFNKLFTQMEKMELEDAGVASKYRRGIDLGTLNVKRNDKIDAQKGKFGEKFDKIGNEIPKTKKKSGIPIKKTRFASLEPISDSDHPDLAAEKKIIGQKGKISANTNNISKISNRKIEKNENTNNDDDLDLDQGFLMDEFQDNIDLDQEIRNENGKETELPRRSQRIKKKINVEK